MKTPSPLLPAILTLFVLGGAMLTVPSDGAEPRLARPTVHDAPAAHTSSLEAWLDSAPTIKERVVWTTGDGKHQHFADWTPAMKSRVETFYQHLCNGTPNLEMHLPPESQITVGGTVYYTVEEAFDLYAAHLAHVIYVESRHLVPWSIQGRPGMELDQLLASSSYVSRIIPSSNTYPDGIKAHRDFQNVPANESLGELNSDPRIGYDFLSGKTSASHKSIIGQTEMETLVNLTAWLRDNVLHGPIDEKRLERFKSLRLLPQRLQAFPGERLALTAQGCHSSSKLMVDLARSVNIPLLHARSMDNTLADDDSGSVFNRSHGGLVYGWGGTKPRIVWHTDEINATSCQTCFPIDDKTGELLSPKQADQKYFDEVWLTPHALIKAGFTYHLVRVMPGKGFGLKTRGEYEDRIDYGLVMGRWKRKGNSALDAFHTLCLDYALCGKNLLLTYNKGTGTLEKQLKENFKAWRGDFTDEELPTTIPSFAELNARAAAAIKALGGIEKTRQFIKEMQVKPGNNLMVQH